MTWKTVYLVAMEDEIKGIFDLEGLVKKQVQGFTVYESPLLKEVIICTGIGKSNAAAAAQLSLQAYPADRYVNTGLVGAFSRSFELGQVLRVDQCRFFDVNVTAFGYEPGQLPGSNQVRYTLGEMSDQHLPLERVSLVSGDTFVSEDHHRQQIMDTFKPDIVDMELTSIAHIFHIHGKLSQLSSLKAVSDYSDGNSDSFFYQVMPQACANLKAALKNVQT